MELWNIWLQSSWFYQGIITKLDSWSACVFWWKILTGNLFGCFWWIRIKRICLDVLQFNVDNFYNSFGFVKVFSIVFNLNIPGLLSLKPASRIIMIHTLLEHVVTDLIEIQTCQWFRISVVQFCSNSSIIFNQINSKEWIEFVPWRATRLISRVPTGLKLGQIQLVEPFRKTM